MTVNMIWSIFERAEVDYPAEERRSLSSTGSDMAPLPRVMESLCLAAQQSLPAQDIDQISFLSMLNTISGARATSTKASIHT